MMRQIADQDLLNTACKTVQVGKETPQAIYLHTSALSQLPTVLRLYEACARGLVGEVEGANIVKLHRYRPQVSYLCYPTFDKEATRHWCARRSSTTRHAPRSRTTAALPTRPSSTARRSSCRRTIRC